MGRSINCYACKAVKENPKIGYCNACKRQKDNEWRLNTGRTLRHRTGKCRCGNDFAPWSNYACQECIAKRESEYRKQNPYTPEQTAHRMELARKRREQNRKPKQLKQDTINQSRREKYHDPEWVASRLKHRVRALTRVYIKSGKLLKGDCEVCGASELIEAHHDDYDKPLDVRWLCRKHHREHHRNVP